ncbi:hypothetical protein L7F22_051676 [Adiantum nelumboides]|nr:hypothetical protein [Adiantum nelumboides]
MLRPCIPASPVYTVSRNSRSCSWTQCAFLLSSHNYVSPLRLHDRHQPLKTWSFAASLLQESAPSTTSIPSKKVLSKEQLAAVESIATCIRVVAGPGSGKTRVLTHRVVHLITNCGVPAQEILLITFTNKAAQEIRDRLKQIFGSEVARDMTVGTFHSLCAKILRWKSCSGLNNNFAIYDEGDSERVVRSILKMAKDAFSQKDGSLSTSESEAEDRYSDPLLEFKTLGFLINGSCENQLMRNCLASSEKAAQRGRGQTAFVPSATIKKLLDDIRRSRLYKMTCFLAEKKKFDAPPLPKGLQQEKLNLATLYETGFVQDRCILDNLFCLHLAMEWAKTSSTPLAILFLDFEKAYDRVKQGFLEGMGFPLAWFRGVFALYRSTTSAVTIGRYVGRRFELSKSMRQGCPMAPYLFVFVAEMMSDFIRARQPALRGLLMPVVDELDLIDQEYADETLLFLLYTPGVLDTIQCALEVFSVASGARINWDKSYDILVGSYDIPTWGPRDFTWLGPGSTCRYLKFQALAFVPVTQLAETEEEVGEMRKTLDSASPMRTWSQ